MTAQRKLSEPAAWREIARRFAEDENDGVGLCFEVRRLEWEKRIAIEMHLRMAERIEAHLYPHAWIVRPDDPEWDRGLQERAVRVIAALFLALESADEIKAQSVPHSPHSDTLRKP